MELKENYEKLANAIILQAVKDYRLARKYLWKHPHTPELDKTVEEQARKRREREEKRKNRGSGKRCAQQKKRKLTREEKLLSRIFAAEGVISDAERFFCSKWFATLTDLDGEELLNRLRKEQPGQTTQTK